MTNATEVTEVTFHLSIGLVGCEQRETVEIPNAEIPEDPTEREKFFLEYAGDIFNGHIEMYWRIEGEDA